MLLPLYPRGQRFKAHLPPVVVRLDKFVQLLRATEPGFGWLNPCQGRFAYSMLAISASDCQSQIQGSNRFLPIGTDLPAGGCEDLRRFLVVIPKKFGESG